LLGNRGENNKTVPGIWINMSNLWPERLGEKMGIEQIFLIIISMFCFFTSGWVAHLSTNKMNSHLFLAAILFSIAGLIFLFKLIL